MKADYLTRRTSECKFTHKRKTPVREVKHETRISSRWSLTPPSWHVHVRHLVICLLYVPLPVVFPRTRTHAGNEWPLEPLVYIPSSVTRWANVTGYIASCPSCIRVCVLCLVSHTILTMYIQTCKNNRIPSSLKRYATKIIHRYLVMRTNIAVLASVSPLRDMSETFK